MKYSDALEKIKEILEQLSIDEAENVVEELDILYTAAPAYAAGFPIYGEFEELEGWEEWEYYITVKNIYGSLAKFMQILRKFRPDIPLQNISLISRAPKPYTLKDEWVKEEAEAFVKELSDVAEIEIVTHHSIRTEND